MPDLPVADASSLFRPEFRQREPRLEGAVILSCPVSIWAPAFLLGLAGMLALIFASVAEYAVSIPAAGLILPDRPIETVSAAAEGTVTAIPVAEGDRVEAGAPVAAMTSAGGTDLSVPAPVAGRVIAVGAAQGTRAVPGDMLVMILPDGATLQAVLTAPAAAVADVRTGQDVRLTWPGMDPRDAAHGRVASVTTAAINLQPAAGAPAGPVRRIVVTLTRPERMPGAGLSVSAQIVQERRSVLGWILQPVAGALRRAGGGADA